MIWKIEEVSIIPKSGWPSEYDQCRNISCTFIFSKLCETYMLDQLYEEIPPEVHQFGEVKKQSADHLLAKLVTQVMEDLNDNRSATSLILVDLSKAFNFVDHTVCTDKLASHGASNQTLLMAANFLIGRKMKIKMGNDIFSSSRDMPGGAPQGTKSGFFCSVRPLGA